MSSSDLAYVVYAQLNEFDGPFLGIRGVFTTRYLAEEAIKEEEWCCPGDYRHYVVEVRPDHWARYEDPD